MQPSASAATASTIPVPDVDIDEPVAIIPTASVAPLDGPPDGERMNSFALLPKNDEGRPFEDSLVDAFGEMRDRVLSKPLTYVAAAFSLGFALARVLR